MADKTERAEYRTLTDEEWAAMALVHRVRNANGECYFPAIVVREELRMLSREVLL